MTNRNRAGGIAAVAFVCAIVLWYAGSARAGAVTIDSIGVAPFSSGAALGAVWGFFSTRSEGSNTAMTAAALAAIVAGGAAYAIVAGANVWFDRSPAFAIAGKVVGIETPKKGPASIVVQLPESGKVTIPLYLGPSCRDGQVATLRVKLGALGKRWVEGLRCE